MKRTSLTMTIMLFLASPVLAEQHTASDNTSATVMTETNTSTSANPGTTRPMHQMGMMHKGKGQHGKGHGGMKHGGGQHGKGQHEKHDQVVRRLDMIEARMAKIEAMLEILMRR